MYRIEERQKATKGKTVVQLHVSGLLLRHQLGQLAVRDCAIGYAYIIEANDIVPVARNAVSAKPFL
jgi:hypothetical protein